MKKYKLIGVPLKYGCNIEGADKGIDVIKRHLNFDYIIDIPTFEEEMISNMLNIEKITKVCEDLSNVVDKTIKEGYIPITIGGDHSLAIGSIAGSSNNNDLSLLWIDTHTDINTHLTTETGRIHGFPVACSIGLGPEQLVNINHDGVKIKGEDVILFGTNDIDDLEYKIVEENKVNNILYEEIEKEGLDHYLEYVLEKFKDKKIHLSFDLDCMNPNCYSSVNVKNRFGKGFTYEQVKKILETVLKLDIVSIDVVEYNPLNDKDGKGLEILLEIINSIKL